MTSADNGTAEVRVRDLLLGALTASSGAVDAMSFLGLGKVFSAFMTGNIAFLGFRVAGAGGPGAPSGDPANDPRTVWVVRDGKALPITVKVGLSDGTYSELVDGDIKEGDDIVTDVTISGGASKPAATGAGGAGTTRMPRL